jgi:hypothetical protein
VPAGIERAPDVGVRAATEIPRKHWAAFFDRFASDHRGHLCTLKVVSHGRETTLLLKPLLFAGVAADDQDRQDLVRVLLTDWWGGALAHAVAGTHHVFLDAARGVEETLELDGAEGRTLMTFHAAD